MTNLKKLQVNQPELDDNEWQEAVKDVKKLSRDYPEPEMPPLVINLETNRHIAYNTLPQSNEELQINTTDGIDNQTAKKFKKEEFKIEAVLDLHGKTEKEAFNLVQNFIKQAYISHKRCILIITGKGLNKQGNDDIFAARGILKNAVPNWLNTAEIRPLILAYKHPAENKGGNGALYILLRRHRD